MRQTWILGALLVTVHASGYETACHRVEVFAMRSGATVRLRPAVPGDVGDK